MPLSAKTVRTQLALFRPLLNASSLELTRKGQNKLGELMEARHRKQILSKEHAFARFKSAWILPHDERRQGVILYLHGGGYTCGDLEYAMGFGSMLAVQCGTRVFCPAYRLAPEHRYPAALEDALEAYLYLTEKGYSPAHITLCGESAGGGLCYALCLKLREMGLEQPAGIIAISPWTDLTASGGSYAKNVDVDPSMTAQRLSFFADCYTDDRTDPFVSPLFASLEGLPPSLLFVGKEEIMLSDTEDLHAKLLETGCKSQLHVKPDRWHGYLLYGLREDVKDFSLINRFLNQSMCPEQKLRWMPLDNAAKIYPAARRQNWSNIFRVSATLKETVDTEILRSALDVTVRRFPSIAVRLRRGLFWYYLEQISHVPEIREEKSYPLTKMSRAETRKCAFRVLVYDKRIALETFHSLTDGNGAMVFLKSLIAEYLQQRYGIHVSPEHGVLGRLEEPSEEELEDSFQKHAGSVCASRRENTAWHPTGTPVGSDFLHLTCFTLRTEDVLKKAHEYHVSLTAFLAAALMQALQNLQREKVPSRRRRKPIKVLIPINLRRLFPSKSLRNFVLYTTPEILPKLGEYSFEEICRQIHHHMGMEITPKRMSMKIATNVKSERLLAIRLVPLFIKNLIMKAVFEAVGERKSCLTLSNLGATRVPPEMEPYVSHFDFILGIQATAPYNCGVISYGDTLRVNFIRNIRESELEYHFHCVLRDMGIETQVESNSTEQ